MSRKEKTYKKLPAAKHLLRIVIVLLICSPFNIRAQDIHFTQFYESPLTLNPALCGAFNGDFRAEINYRNQWAASLGSGYEFSTMAASAEYKNVLQGWKGGFLSPGISFFSDKAGTIQLTTTEVNFSLAGGVYLDPKNTITAGLQGGWSQNSMNLQNVPWDEQYINGQYDPNAATGEPLAGHTLSYSDFSGGLLYNYSSSAVNIASSQYVKYNVGVAFFHINQPDMSFYGTNGPGTNLYIRYVFHAGAEFKMSGSNMALAPLAVFYRQGPAQEIDLGIKLRYALGLQSSHYTDFSKSRVADFGIYYRAGDAFIALLQMEFPSYSIGFSYDINTSQYISATTGQGAWEISLRYTPQTKVGNGDSHSMF